MTNPKLPTSVFIIALNEVDRIAATILSVRDWVDEVIVIDSGSSDDTVSVAEFSGAQVIYNPWEGYGPQKRFAEDQCRNRWLLNLDADEVVSELLAEEIKQKFADGSIESHQGWYLHITEIMPGQSKPSRFAHVTTAVRLYDKRHGRYAESTVHDRVHFERDCILGTLHHIVEHRSSRGLTHSLNKINNYSTMQAQNAPEGKGIAYAHLRLLIEFPLAFCKAYFGRAYILQGRLGFVNAVVYGFSRFIRIAKYLEKRKD